jgi:putative restriction endonuclease
LFDRVQDAKVRAAAFEWLSTQVESYGDVLPRTLLADGFMLDDMRVPLLGPQGIFQPKVLEEAPLSITTAPKGPYDDSFGADGLLRYRYRGTDPDHPDNRGLRFAIKQRLPLVYFHGVVPGKYVAAWPVFVVGDDPPGLSFQIAVDDVAHMGLGAEPALVVNEDEGRSAGGNILQQRCDSGCIIVLSASGS